MSLLGARPSSGDDLRQWLQAPEGSQFEFKTAKGGYDFGKLVDYCVALANEGGGKIILGVTDRRPRAIVGTAAFEEPGRTEAGLYDRLSHRIPVEEVRLPEGRVLVVHVPPRLPGTAWQVDGQYWKRAGDGLVGMPADELRAIFAETGPDFSAEPCQGATLADLSAEAIAAFRQRWATKARDERRLSWTDEETLTSAELLVDGHLTYAALILFGTRPTLGRRLAQAEVVFEYRSSESPGPAGDRVEYREGWFLFHDQLWDRINLRNDRQSYQEGFFRTELPTFDEVAVREALLNAVAHRDYRLGGSIFVRQFARRLEVVSPGGLPPGITPTNILDQQNPRNRRLAEALARCGLIERAGQGMDLMVARAIRQGKALPSFEGTAAHEVRLTLDGLMAHPDLVRFIERLGEATVRTFSAHEFMVLEHLVREAPIPEHLRPRLPGLIAAGAVEARGRGKGTQYMLSLAVYEALGTPGVYTRKRGLDRETNKALLEKHIRGAREHGAPLSELRDVLPAASDVALKKLLQELREEGRAHTIGVRRWARWFPDPLEPSLEVDA